MGLVISRPTLEQVDIETYQKEIINTQLHE